MGDLSRENRRNAMMAYVDAPNAKEWFVSYVRYHAYYLYLNWFTVALGILLAVAKCCCCCKPNKSGKCAPFLKAYSKWIFRILVVVLIVCLVLMYNRFSFYDIPFNYYMENMSTGQTN